MSINVISYVKIIYRIFHCIKNLRIWDNEIGVNILKKDICPTKKKENIYIIGTGPSARQLTTAEKDYLKDQTTIGLNNAAGFDFICSLYLIELVGNCSKIVENLTSKAANHEKIKVIVKGNYLNIPVYNKEYLRAKKLKSESNINLKYIKDFPIPAESKEMLIKNLKIIDRLGLFKSIDVNNWFAQTRGTLTTAIIYAAKCGYKNVYLVGVDLRNIIESKERMGGETSDPHPTEVTNNKILKMSQIIQVYQEYLHENYGINLYVTSEISLLNDVLEYRDIVKN